MTPEELADRCDSTARKQPLPNDTDLVLQEAARMIRTQAKELARMTEALADIVGHARYAIDPAGRIESLPKKRKPKGSQPGCGPLVYLVEDTGYAPGRILAVLADNGDAYTFAGQLENAEVRPRKLWYGQPTNMGYNE